MDQTELFRAVVKAVRLQLKAQREATGSAPGTPVHTHPTKHTKKPTVFTASANDVVKILLNIGMCIGRGAVFIGLGDQNDEPVPL